MPDHDDAVSTVEDTNFRFGRFWYYIDEDRWQWSDELARLHGYESAAVVVPTSDILLRHKHPDDKERVAELIERVRRGDEPFSSRHRIVDLIGNVVPVIVLAELIVDPTTGRRRGTSGFYVAEPPTRAMTATTDAYVKKIPGSGGMDIDEVVRRRATIERAKGALMLVYRLDEQQAFDLLVWRSQESNTKLHTLAAVIETRFAEVDVSSATRSSFDQVLLSAHEEYSASRRDELDV